MRRQTTSDLIDRAEAVMALRLEYPMMPLFKSLREEWAIKTEGYRKAEEVIMRLPSVDVPTTMTGAIDAWNKRSADRPKGEWMSEGRVYPPTSAYHSAYCSHCGEWSEYLTDYCGNCGADMRGDNDGKDIQSADEQ